MVLEIAIAKMVTPSVILDALNLVLTEEISMADYNYFGFVTLTTRAKAI